MNCGSRPSWTDWNRHEQFNFTGVPSTGQIWMINLDPARGHEQAGTRPVLILSVDAFNSGPADLVVILPITSRLRGVRSHVDIQPPNGGLSMKSCIMCEAVRSVTKQRLMRRIGDISSKAMLEVEDKLRIILGL